MPKIIRNAKKKLARMERGQVLVVVALSAVGVIAIIGLAIDVGLMFVGNARLRRAVDAAALSAALQYRQSADIGPLTHAATEFLTLNGVTVDSVTVDTCVTYTGTNPCSTGSNITQRKLVRVHAIAKVKLAFLPVIGINSATISATAVSEAASLDVILVIDRSESMAYDANSGDPMRDPSYCNGISFTDRYGYQHTSSCAPFNDVTTAAIGFANSLFYPYDYAAVVTFDKKPHLDLSLVVDPINNPVGNTKAKIIDTLQHLTVFQGADSYNHASSTTEDYGCYGGVTSTCTGTVFNFCSAVPIIGAGSNYQGLIGQKQDPCLTGYVNPPDPSHYTTTNIGGGLELAANELPKDYQRQQALWVVILLTDGVANAGYGGADPNNPSYYCPQGTWGNLSLKTPSGDPDPLPLCNHGDPTFRNPKNDPNYDASDYAYDMADFVGLPYDPVTLGGGQHALIYTIGLGSELTKYTRNTGSYPDPYSLPVAGATGEGLGTIFLNYAAHVGNGQAFYAATGADLDKIFQLIGSKIATRLTQ